MYDEKLLLKGAGFARHQLWIPGCESHHAMVSFQRTHISSGMAPTCD
jgi:hypothetical protein